MLSLVKKKKKKGWPLAFENKIQTGKKIEEKQQQQNAFLNKTKHNAKKASFISFHVFGCCGQWKTRCLWAIQEGLLTPLTFARYRLSPLAAFTSGAYFFHNERRWQWSCEFYIAKFFEDP